MARVVHAVSSRRRHKKLIKRAKGAFGQRKNVFRRASETLQRAGAFAFRDRRAKKRTYRGIWIIRINAACVNNGIKYSRFMSGLKKAKVDINRKLLADMAVRDEKSFKKLVELAKTA